MNIVIFVDFSSSQFNMDFKLSNALTTMHTVFLASNIDQLNELRKKADKVLIGYSRSNTIESKDDIYCNKYSNIDSIVEMFK